MLEHGGRLNALARHHGVPAEAWLDLSTGINPQPWPVTALPASAWTRLPEDDDGLREAACAFYAAHDALPVAGSQAALQALPGLFRPGRVGILRPSFAEHELAWRRAGHQIRTLRPDVASPDGLDALVLIHPNNPTGHTWPRAQLLAWHEQLAARGGVLVVDEAFMDATPEASLVAQTDRPGLVVLRSLGKFFGLAGARVGFALAETKLLRRLGERLGPWPLTGPSRQIARLALADSHWHAQARQRLVSDSARLAALLDAHGLRPGGGSALFQWVAIARAATIAARLAERAIHVRHFDQPPSLRFGLPGRETDWQRLNQALQEITR